MQENADDYTRFYKRPGLAEHAFFCTLTFINEIA